MRLKGAGLGLEVDDAIATPILNNFATTYGAIMGIQRLALYHSLSPKDTSCFTRLYMISNKQKAMI